MLKITQIPNLFSSTRKLTSHIIPLQIINPDIKPKLLKEFGEELQHAWVISLVEPKDNNTVFYTCITSLRGNMFRIEYIETKHSEIL